MVLFYWCFVSAKESQQTVASHSGYCFPGIHQVSQPHSQCDRGWYSVTRVHPSGFHVGAKMSRLGCQGSILPDRMFLKPHAYFSCHLKTFWKPCSKHVGSLQVLLFLSCLKSFMVQKAGFCEFTEGFKKSLNCFIGSDSGARAAVFSGNVHLSPLWCMSVLSVLEDQQSSLCLNVSREARSLKAQAGTSDTKMRLGLCSQPGLSGG